MVLSPNKQKYHHRDTENTERKQRTCHCKFVICNLAISEMTNDKFAMTNFFSVPSVSLW
jgi:hypothetical protein